MHEPPSDLPEGIDRFDPRLPRHAFGPRHTARAGDLWRLLQEVATDASSRRGWPPSRYAAQGSSFIIRAMRAVHHREIDFGEALTAHTWIKKFQRGLFCDRQLQVFAQGALALSATQAWVHVHTDPLRPARAPDALLQAFPLLDRDSGVRLPDCEATEPIAFSWTFASWHTWMDPLGHANHPAYVDWCDEALCRRLGSGGYDPVQIIPVAEEVQFRSGAVAPEVLTIDSQLSGLQPDPAGMLIRCTHAIKGREGRLLADATTWRRLPGVRSEPQLRALFGP